ncbi:MAG: hypothetical protein F6J95_007270 [Leptolyngbya sp. SIO1E4]|nr:hypothetical protein [Leptolyngbya sp. SIO1E4]
MAIIAVNLLLCLEYPDPDQVETIWSISLANPLLPRGPGRRNVLVEGVWGQAKCPQVTPLNQT